MLFYTEFAFLESMWYASSLCIFMYIGIVKMKPARAILICSTRMFTGKLL